MKSSVLPVYAAFFLSGAAALGYELVWTRMLSVGMGHELPSVPAAVAAYVGPVRE